MLLWNQVNIIALNMTEPRCTAGLAYLFLVMCSLLYVYGELVVQYRSLFQCISW